MSRSDLAAQFLTKVAERYAKTEYAGLSRHIVQRQLSGKAVSAATRKNLQPTLDCFCYHCGTWILPEEEQDGAKGGATDSSAMDSSATVSRSARAILAAPAPRVETGGSAKQSAEEGASSSSSGSTYNPAAYEHAPVLVCGFCGARNAYPKGAWRERQLSLRASSSPNLPNTAVNKDDKRTAAPNRQRAAPPQGSGPQSAAAVGAQNASQNSSKLGNLRDMLRGGAAPKKSQKQLRKRPRNQLEEQAKSSGSDDASGLF